MSESAYAAEGTNEIRLTLHSGKQLDLRTMQSSDFDIEDIAHALSNICRFHGHVPEFYSVAQHSIFVANLLMPELRLQGLMHDASEAYLNDLSHFLKHSPELVGYRALESALEEKISAAFKLPYPLHAKIKLADRTAGDVEWNQFMRGEPTVLFEPIKPWSPKKARTEFLNTYRQLAHLHGIRAITRL